MLLRRHLLRQRPRQRPPPPPAGHAHSCSFPFLFFLLAAAAAPAATAAAPPPAAAQRTLPTPHSNATDVEALRVFQSRAAPNGALSSLWTDPADFCRNWLGVTCSRRRQRVTELSLPRASLAGTIPPHIGNLNFLVSLNLTGNQLTGALPGAALAGLRRLRHLDLSSNNLTGSIPAELGSLPALQTLDLKDNQFTGAIPGALGQLSTLQILTLDENVGINGEIPPELGRLSQLRKLSLITTNLTGEIPPELGDLANLEELYITDSQEIVGELPIELGNLAKLKVLNLAKNYLGGTFPAAVYNMSSLVDLVLAYNNLEVPLPLDLGRRLPRSLKRLYLNANYINGTIPSSLSNASMLSTLELSYNSFEGRIPPELGALRELTVLNVANNSLSGPLDFLGALTNCRKLQQLILLNNNFSGSLPASAIANFTNTDLNYFVGQGNSLTGSLPHAFGNLTKLYTVVLSYNMLSGVIPPGLVALPNLQRLYLEDNRLEGPIPPEIGSAKQLGLLYLQHNNLSGPIPDSIGDTDLQRLDLGQNKLNSTLPQGLWRLTGLIELNLAQNRLEGELSDALATLTDLTNLNFSSNRFSGGIPSRIGKLQMLQELRLANNNFSGPLPPSLGSLAELNMLDVSSNSLSGGIPSSLARLTALENLNLSFNRLEGQVPRDGVFGRASPGITNASFAGNLVLCGAPWFGIPACKEAPGKRGRHKVIVIASVLAAVVLLLAFVLVLFFVLARRREENNRKRNSPDPLSKEDRAGHPLISRHELAIATDGFSEANLIGAGSVGKVYGGRLADGTPVAVKVLDLQMGESAWRSFEVECTVMRTVRHRNLVGIITTCSNLDFRALVLPLMPNGSLEKWIHPSDANGPRLSLQQRVEAAADVATALEYLHHGCSEPVVHCDLKPSNVLLDGEMIAHIGDFGIAKVLMEHSRSATRTGTPGTFGYMAPEYGTGGRVTTKGDVYSYGILLLEIFTGKRPTEAMFSSDVNLRSWVASAFPDGVEDLVEDCLLQDQTEEPSSGSSSSSAMVNSNGDSSIKSRNTARRSGREGSLDKEQRRQRCLVAVLELGLACSSESLKDRPDMVEVVAKLKKIGGNLLSSS